MAKETHVAQWQRAVISLSGTVIAVTVVAVLYWAQPLLIPVALAVYFTFLLNPLVRLLQRLHIGRVAAVLLVVVWTGLMLSALGWVVGRQVTGLMAKLPDNTARIRGKIKALREHSGPVSRLEEMMDQISGDLKSPLPADGAGPSAERPAVQPAPAPAPAPEVPSWFGQLPSFVGSAASALAALALTLVLTVFMLLHREDLRNRFLRLVGHGRISATTKAVDDAAQRVSRYLLTQALLNSAFGVCVAIGLSLLHVEYALLWGLMAAVMRYVPYIGTWVACIFPLALSFAISEVWWQPLAVFGLYLALEMISGNVLEPVLYGQSIGITPMAQLVSAAFWAFLWGPVGLVLSAPLTVVLVVLGKYVPQMQFLDILLGDHPALDEETTYYQRLLAHDQDEAEQLALDKVKAAPTDQVYDDLLIPALIQAKRDREGDNLSDTDEAFIYEATREILEDLGHQRHADAPADGVPAEAPVRILACPARDQADRLALDMLAQLLDERHWNVEVVGADALTGEILERTAEEVPAMIVIGALPPGGLARARYLCKRLRSQFPSVKILVGRWGLESSVEQNREQLQEAGAELMSTTLLETRNQLGGWLPILAKEQETATVT